MEVLVDHKPLFHHFHSRNHHRLFPKLHHDKLRHDLHGHQHLQQDEYHLQYKWCHLYIRSNILKQPVESYYTILDPVQPTPASSLCRQSLFPQPLCLHSDRYWSAVVHCTSSNQIGNEVSTPPKKPPV